MLTLIVLRCFNLSLIRLYPNLYSKHSEINENCDFLVLFDNRIHCFALRRQIEPKAMSLHAYDNKHITSHAKNIQLILRFSCKKMRGILHPFLMSFIPSNKMRSYSFDKTSKCPLFTSMLVYEA